MGVRSLPLQDSKVIAVKRLRFLIAVFRIALALGRRDKWAEGAIGFTRGRFPIESVLFPRIAQYFLCILSL